MITYKDMCWCAQDCGNLDCFRNYTPEERQRNDEGVDLPLDMADFKSDECGFVEREDLPAKEGK